MFEFRSDRRRVSQEEFLESFQEAINSNPWTTVALHVTDLMRRIRA
jgi:hypothetical protein